LFTPAASWALMYPTAVALACRPNGVRKAAAKSLADCVAGNSDWYAVELAISTASADMLWPFASRAALSVAR